MTQDKITLSRQPGTATGAKITTRETQMTLSIGAKRYAIDALGDSIVVNPDGVFRCEKDGTRTKIGDL